MCVLCTYAYKMALYHGQNRAIRRFVLYTKSERNAENKKRSVRHLYLSLFHPPFLQYYK